MAAPHVVIPKIAAALQAGLPKPPAAETVTGGEPVTQGAGLGGIRERQADRTGEPITELQSRLAADKEKSIRAGYSMTGDTIFL